MTQEEFDQECEELFNYLEERRGRRMSFKEALDDTTEQFNNALTNLAEK